MSVFIWLLTIVLIIFIIVAIVIMILRIISTKRLPFFILLFLILPVGQLFMLHSFRYETWSAFWLAGVFLALLADILLLIYAISQEKKTAVEEELKEARHTMVLEKSHYESALERREELAEIRRDFNEKLEAVTKLVGRGRDESARQYIANLAGKINQTAEGAYCNIPVVNAVLTEKGKECALAGIELIVEISLPKALAVSPMHLCSIFSNILDNAIAACKKAQNKDKPVIRLSSLIDGDYLFVKAVNPSDRPGQRPISGRGYGLRIISELAKQYEGGLQTNYRDGQFTAIVTLLALRPVYK